MKLLSIHCDSISYKPLKKALKQPEELSEERSRDTTVKEALVIFSAVEKQDEGNTTLVHSFVKEIIDIAEQVHAKNIVLYPYAHLSSSLSAPEFALEVMQNAEKELVEKKYKVWRAPFGYYKEFSLKCKGHPLSELSRVITSEGTGLKKGESKGEVTVEPKELESLVKKLSKNTMHALRGKNNLKSNVEIGKELDVYLVNEVVGQGLVLFTPKGTIIKKEIERFIVDEELKRGYLHTSTPLMAKSDLYKVSGHWQHYQDSMFCINTGHDILALRPMTCPFHFILYKSKNRSYKELPLKYAEIATLFRNEQSGELRGLTRVRQFTLADAHIICRKDQVEKQFEEVVELLNYVMKVFDIKDIWYRFSQWDPHNKKKYIDNPQMWEESQKMMKKILDRLKINYKEVKGEAAFYGPKLDLQYKDVYDKEETLLTVQIDFALPIRYDLTYLDEKGEQVRPVVIHRSSTGATERLMAFLLEKTQGLLPLWLAPVQVRVINFTDRNNKSCEKLWKELREKNVRVDLDLVSEPLAGKIKQAEIEKIPYIVVIGDKEEKAKALAVRKKGKVTTVKKEKFIENIIKEIKEKSVF